ncbi:putative tellurite resistance protein B-like protein [Pontibacter aydingkolensis]|uniref:TerB family tellurite resistance protein n=1 Tax=Pontibacter aydingkolensis TaxID=1911536 RepID=A0ABS7CVU3_9BACT|nr:TerB family tellurite resistance protein [Pontibacter aydingkolensis]MBW7467622.1 TerB family tellurite resistance protein [Pontibacter aydingkolensis]
MEQEQTVLLKDYTNEEKGAYLGALATIASADGNASEEELEFLRILSEAAEMPDNVEQEVVQIAQNPSQISLQKCLDVLKKSQLRFPFVTDIISFAKADGQYSSEEQKHIQHMAECLEIDQKQYSILEQYVDKAEDAQQHGEDPTSNSFLNKSGFGDMFKNAGISPGMVKGILGVAAPLVLASMMRRGGGRRGMMGGMGGGLLGGLLGGMMGGSGGMRRGGGLGSMASILGGLNGRRGYGSMGSGGLGGLLGGILGGGSRRGSGW